jgi:hypothetical protein
MEGNMFLDISAKIILYSKPVRMYKGFDSLLSLVMTELNIELIANTYVLFVNANRDRFKMLFFDQGNISLFAMRLPTPMIIQFEKDIILDSKSFRELIKNLKPKRSRKYYKINEN